MRQTCLAILILAMPVFAQLDSNAITVTASRTLYLTPDQVRFSIVSTAGGASLNDVLAALQGTATTIDNSNLPIFQALSLTVPVAQMGETIATLRELQVNYSVTGTEPSAVLPACSRTDLIADATAKARALAAAAGQALGRILAVSDGGAQSGAAVPAFRQGDFSQTIGTPFPGNIIPAGRVFRLAPLSTSPAMTCSLTVKFALGR